MGVTVGHLACRGTSECVDSCVVEADGVPADGPTAGHMRLPCPGRMQHHWL